MKCRFLIEAGVDGTDASVPVAACERCFSDMFGELCEVFTPEDALKFEGRLPGYEGVVYKKASVNGEGWQLIRVNPSVVKMLTALGPDPSPDVGAPENAEIKS